MDALNLSKRLALVASFVPDNARLADIGSDHAYLPANLLLNQRIAFGIAGEVAPGPLANVEHEVHKAHLESKLIARLGDGFAAIQPDDAIDTVVIAGMGGRLIADILASGHEQEQNYQRLILQPNTDVLVVRAWLQANGYALIDEAIVYEDHHYYEVLVAEPGESHFSDIELHFGPYHLKRQNSVWQQHWHDELERIQHILVRLQAAKKAESAAYQAYATQSRQIQEALQYESK
ncbi:tRNA (adenine(22)-N(1))-methyltransferase TrmK [Weissella diestrammenae]|uniref:tRNA (Adenine(22)-N(1))-methyltransferase TrmK n=1 Tax=Weissella diestrammenae TaxID=1162633 RepID=A0A7G9T7G1_9LACO|nr:class I SAM-dependent methyltransferase [Weissella diestrammenae]MCM0582193.1 tRNA (adenine(22)-N(1))-methyltransferase TrmK [Weissella diestrammenae]QNN76036.1 tRNA (adenine(22)-N(1))-methyltransferase TrmK [Weissella diestrammenae]